MTARRKARPKPLHPASPLPTMRILLHLLRRNTYATDFGLDAIFARPGLRAGAETTEP